MTDVDFPSSEEIRALCAVLRRMAKQDNETAIVEACDRYVALLDAFERQPSRRNRLAMEAQFEKLDRLQDAYILRVEGPSS